MRWHHGVFTIDSYQEVSSTNDFIIDLANNHEISDNHAIVANSQTNGHGRYGRKWDSPQGNLYFSILLKSKAKQTDSLLSFLSAVCLSRTIRDLSGDNASLSHKWPNDVLLNNKKVAGILLKNITTSNKINYVVVGIGLNINSHPSDTIFEATNLSQENIVNFKPEEILKIFLNNFNKLYQEFNQFGFTPIRNLWLQDAYRLGQEINVNLADQKLTAIFKDLNNSGNLILKIDNKTLRTIESGEIFT